jgi:hypothetical protein
VVCGTSSGTNARCGGFEATTSATGVRFTLGRQAAKGLVEQLAERIGVDVADHGDAQVSLAITLPDIGAQVARH